MCKVNVVLMLGKNSLIAKFVKSKQFERFDFSDSGPVVFKRWFDAFGTYCVQYIDYYIIHIVNFDS
jgi:hypothetical protein